MTIRHPANVKNILASGIDSLVISSSIVWKDKSFFTVLDEAKEKAQKDSTDCHVQIKHFCPEQVWPFTIKPNGTDGFTWILIGSDFTYKIRASVLGPRPNVMIEIRSETLWHLDPEKAVKTALLILEANGAYIVKTKLSRVDLCVDFLMPEKRWSLDGLMEYVVTRATDYVPHYKNRQLTGITIGRGEILARLYDKPLEIKQKSHKDWMYDIWGISEVPEKMKIIRIEFQLRRNLLKELGLYNYDVLFEKSAKAWAYCTQDWLKFQDRPGLHHTQRSTLDWYKEIQNGFKGIQGAEPLVREKAIRADKKRLMQQVNGLITSLHAINMEEQGADRSTKVNLNDCIKSYAIELRKYFQSPSELQEKIKRKRSKYHRVCSTDKEGQKRYKIRWY
jgi:hypothetical protein